MILHLVCKPVVDRNLMPPVHIPYTDNILFSEAGDILCPAVKMFEMKNIDIFIEVVFVNKEERRICAL